MLPGKGFDGRSNLAAGKEALKIIRRIKSQVSELRISAKIFESFAFDLQLAICHRAPARAADCIGLSVDLTFGLIRPPGKVILQIARVCAGRDIIRIKKGKCEPATPVQNVFETTYEFEHL